MANTNTNRLNCIKFFGQLDNDFAKLTYDMKIALRSNNYNNYKYYDEVNDCFEICNEFVVDMPFPMYWILTNEIKVGDDIFITDKEVGHVIEVTEKGFKAKNYENSSVVEFTKEKDLLFKNKMYEKIINPMIMFGGNDNNEEEMKKIMLLQAMTNNQNINPMLIMMLMGKNKNLDMKNILLMQSLMNGNNNNLLPFFLMQNNSFDFPFLKSEKEKKD